MMGDKIFGGKSSVVLFSADENGKAMTPIGNVIEHSVVYDDIPDDTVAASGCYHFEINATPIESKVLAALLFGDNAENCEYGLVIQSELHVLRPKNLKYPNKKRSRRIWKKWAKRYGTRGGESLVIPRATVKTDAGGIHIEAQKVKED